ncbi:hypothetical protein MSG34_19050 [Vibrio sp. 1CM2L]|uniref:hypothetical protein n=1 Tax=Vibrio TaxID=662 RepID=UPI00097586E9|nr:MULTISPECIES: hypothetical protein [Vibrio]MCK8078264.1 hypothetical protein [Vibrio sp. 1CM2L]OMO33436.1 hypothetical protein BH582_07000 [Vibrio sp. 10N.222.47.A9]
MESRIPLPTDNIYKFYALFGLLLVVFASGALLFVNQSSNNLIYELTVDHRKLSNTPEQARSLEEEARLQIIESKLQVSSSNKNFFIACISVIITIGSVMVGYGFRTWHTVIQPLQDEISRLNIKKLKQEVGEE